MTSQEIAVAVIAVLMGGGVLTLCVYIFVLILRGKADGMIAGYNTMTDEEKARYDIVRLRKVVGYFGMAMVAWTVLEVAKFYFGRSVTAEIIMWSLLVIMIVCYFWVANTWAKKK